jgi:hypothetical protein
MITEESWDDAVAVTPHATVAQFNSPAAGFVVGAAGNVNLVTARGTSVIVPAAAGIPIKLAFTWIKIASTTATGIVALINQQYKGDR